MEFFSRRKKEILLDKDFLLHQRNTELDVMRGVLGKMAESNMDVSFMTGAIRSLGGLTLHEERDLRFLIVDLEETAASRSYASAGLLKQLALLRSARAIAIFNLTLTDPKLPEEKKTELKEATQMHIYDASVSMNDDEFGVLIDYLEELTPDIAGIDFTNEESIAIAKELI